MSMIKIENLTFCYPSGVDNVFENVNAVIDTDWKLALTGRNGRGKTTLLKLLLGKYEYSGSIKSNVKFDYFPYEIEDKRKMVSEIFADICPLREEWEFIRELSYLGVEADLLYMPFEYLSNGEQTKVLLAALFLNEGHFLLIDEPTNHLDTQAREQVSKYLNKKKGFILVSHDKNFLDGCVDYVMALNRSNIEIKKGNFTTWLNDFEMRQALEQEQNNKLKKEIKRLKQSAEQSAEWARKTEASKIGTHQADRGFIGHKAAKMMKHAKVIESRQQQMIEDKTALLKNVEIADKLQISPAHYHSSRLVNFAEVQIVYDGRAINKPISFDINQGDRIALNGGNGCGKSSLIKLLVGQNIQFNGKLTIGSGLKVSYVPQDVSILSGNIRKLLQESNVREEIFMSVLNKMGVEDFVLNKDICNLSDGQKKKVLIAKSLCECVHLYIWDEPLNYIDIYCRIQIEKLIKEFCPTMIFIEHDSSFRDEVATEIINI